MCCQGTQHNPFLFIPANHVSRKNGWTLQHRPLTRGGVVGVNHGVGSNTHGVVHGGPLPQSEAVSALETKGTICCEALRKASQRPHCVCLHAQQYASATYDHNLCCWDQVAAERIHSGAEGTHAVDGVDIRDHNVLLKLHELADEGEHSATSHGQLDRVAPRGPPLNPFTTDLKRPGSSKVCGTKGTKKNATLPNQKLGRAVRSCVQTWVRAQDSAAHVYATAGGLQQRSTRPDLVLEGYFW